MKQLTQNIVKLALDLLLSTNGTTTTLDVKKHLRLLDYNAKQQEVHDFIDEIYEEYSNDYSRTLINNHYYEYSLIVPQNIVVAALASNNSKLLNITEVIDIAYNDFKQNDDIDVVNFSYVGCHFDYNDFEEQLSDVRQLLSKKGLELKSYDTLSFNIKKGSSFDNVLLNSTLLQDNKTLPTGSLMKVDSKSLLSNVQPKFELPSDQLDVVKSYPNKKDWAVYKTGEKILIFDGSLTCDKARSRYVSIVNVERKGVSVKRVENII